MKPNLEIKIGSLKLKNPVMVASGTFGYAEDYVAGNRHARLSAKPRACSLHGAIITKTITLKPRRGNPMPRTCETPAGMLNSIGLENPVIDAFIKEKLPKFLKLGAPIIVSIASEGDPEEFAILAKRLDKIKEVAGIELNISCPNIKTAVGANLCVRPKRLCRGVLQYAPTGQTHRSTPTLIAQDAKATYNVVRAVRNVTNKTLITKLSPNVTDIAEIAKAAENAGSDAISLVNTFLGMAIDIDQRKPKLANITGGLSGPAIKPIAIRMVYEVSKSVNIPVIGMGGIMTAQDALEFIIAGATAVQVGTANFVNPSSAIDIIDGLTKYLKENKIKQITSLRGALSIAKGDEAIS